MEQRGKSCPSAGRLEAEPGLTRAVRVTVGPAPFAGSKPEPPGWAGADPGSRSLGFPRLSPSTLTGAATSHPGQSDRGKGCLAGRGTLRQAGVRACGRAAQGSGALFWEATPHFHLDAKGRNSGSENSFSGVRPPTRDYRGPCGSARVPASSPGCVASSRQHVLPTAVSEEAGARVL